MHKYVNDDYTSILYTFKQWYNYTSYATRVTHTTKNEFMNCITSIFRSRV